MGDCESEPKTPSLIMLKPLETKTQVKYNISVCKCLVAPFSSIFIINKGRTNVYYMTLYFD